MFRFLYNLIAVILFIILLNTNGINTQGGKQSSNEIFKNVSLSTPLECSRTCREDEPPKTCYYKFFLEYYTVLGHACNQCTPNSTNSLWSTCQCVLADGIERSFFSVNRMLPGPSIEICEGDEVIVDVMNQIASIGVTIHWHGISQNGTQYYDGAPYITQCPFGTGNTFRYRWIGNEAGTYFWHSHTGFQRLDGVSGTLTIRQPKSKDPHSDLYDQDLRTHTIFLSDWLHEYSDTRFPGLRKGNKTGQDPENVLINGKGRYRDPSTGEETQVPLEEFRVSSGYRYRFRVINAFSTMCLTAVTVQNHSLTVIASDAKPLRPVTVDTIILSTGERYDFIINANQTPGRFWIQVRLIEGCSLLQISQLAILRYENEVDGTMTPNPTFHHALPSGIILNAIDGNCDHVRSNALCVNQLRRLDNKQEKMQNDVDFKKYISFGFHIYTEDELFEPNTYKRFGVAPTGVLTTAHVDGISYGSAQSPPISQMNSIPPGTFCNSTSKPANCKEICFCTHMISVPLNSNVEIIIFDTSDVPGLLHPFHLHGYTFSVVGMGKFTSNKLTLDYIEQMDKEGLLQRNLDSPPLKDTVLVPQNGYAIIRFHADNPGYWFFHCHINFHVIQGMAMILHVGTNEDLPPVPEAFPKCGHYLPPL